MNGNKWEEQIEYQFFWVSHHHLPLQHLRLSQYPNHSHILHSPYFHQPQSSSFSLSYLHKEKTPLSFETILQTQMRKKRKNKKGKAENTWPRNALFLYLLLVSSCIICLELFIVSFVSLLGEGKIRIFWHYMIAPSSCPWVYKLLDQGKKEKSNWISVSEGWMQTELQ